MPIGAQPTPRRASARLRSQNKGSIEGATSRAGSRIKRTADQKSSKSSRPQRRTSASKTSSTPRKPTTGRTTNPPTRHKVGSKPRYQYKAFDTAANQIRLLTLLPGKLGTKVRISLDTVALTEGNVPKYEAISYAWGSAGDPLSVEIGVDAELLITPNLFTALPYLRHVTQERVLWIDAICVDQQNLWERSQQVERMKDVFSLAERVIVWLGPETNDSNLALSALQALSLEIRYDWIRETMEPRPGRNPKYADPTIALSYDDTGRTIASIFSLLHQPWFERLWIWQEICLAKSSSLIQCGQVVLPWIDFCNAVGCIYDKGWEGNLSAIDARVFSDRITSAYILARTSLRDMSYVLSDSIAHTRSSNCTDLRDRIYALLSLMYPSEAELIKPDYNKTPSQVYRETFIDITEHTTKLDLLRLCDLRNKLPDCPTWIPNFNEVRKTAQLPITFASGAWSACETQFMQEGILRVVGRKVDIVKQCLGFVPARGSELEVIRLIRDSVYARGIDTESQYVGGGSMLEAFCRVIGCNEFIEQRDALDFPRFREAKDAMRDILLITPTEEFESALNSFDNSFIHSGVRGRTLVTTDDGYLGLAPQEVKVGDAVCIIPGCRVPMILRPTRERYYLVVGESFVQGLMDAEALLGPLSEDWQIKRRFTEDGRTMQGFLNLRTGETTKDDPRLAGIDLPHGWETQRHDQEEFFNMFHHTTTGQITYKDPRLSSKSLTTRDVDMQTFDLV